MAAKLRFIPRMLIKLKVKDKVLKGPKVEKRLSGRAHNPPRSIKTETLKGKI